MKKIGLVGGMSWTSTLDYYKYLNQGVNERLGGLQSAECLIHSLNFADIQDRGWINSFDLVFDACQGLETQGAEAIVLCANTAHLFANEIQQKLDIPLLHIATSTATSINSAGLKNVGLLGTRFTMEKEFYRDKLKEFGLSSIIPQAQEDIKEIQRILKDELGKDIVKENSRQKFLGYAKELIAQGAEGIILGCTEIPMLIGQSDFEVPVFDTTRLHVESIIDFALS